MTDRAQKIIPMYFYVPDMPSTPRGSILGTTVLSHLSDMFSYPNFGVKKVSTSLKCENYQFPASVCVKKDLQNRSVRRIFCGNNDICWSILFKTIAML